MLTPTWSPFTRLGRPLEAHGVHSAEEYLAWQERVIANNRRRRPERRWRAPFTNLKPVAPIVNGGRWGIVCPDCLNFAIYSPEWRLACCGECGAIYRNVPPAEDQDYIEQTLMARPAASTRNWNTMAALEVGPAESVEDLAGQNTERGDRVPEAVRSHLEVRIARAAAEAGAELGGQ